MTSHAKLDLTWEAGEDLNGLVPEAQCQKNGTIYVST